MAGASSGDVQLFTGNTQQGPYLNLSKSLQDLFHQSESLGKNSGAAEDTYRNLGSGLDNLFETYGQGQRQQINQRFDTQKNNALGSLAKRGFSGSSLAGSTGSAEERDRSLALGSFEDQLLGQKIGAKKDVAQGLAGAQMGGAQISQSLREALLGLKSATSTDPPNPGAGGGSGGNSGSTWNTDLNKPGYYDQITQPGQGGGQGSGGGGGGGGGNNTGGVEKPGFIENPYAKSPDPATKGTPDWADPNKAKAMGGFSSTGPPGKVGETYVVGGLTCTVTANKGGFSERTCVPTSAIDQPQTPEQPPATGGIPGDLGDYGTVA